MDCRGNKLRRPRRDATARRYRYAVRYVSSARIFAKPGSSRLTPARDGNYSELHLLPGSQRAGASFDNLFMLSLAQVKTAGYLRET
jgi:hypothetical protein